MTHINTYHDNRKENPSPILIEYFNNITKIIFSPEKEKINELIIPIRERYNDINPNIFNPENERHRERAEKYWERISAQHQVRLERLDDEAVAALKNSYQARLKQIAEAVALEARKAGATHEIDIDALTLVIEKHHRKRENHSVKFFVELVMQGDRALHRHLDALRGYSPFTTAQLQSIFAAATARRDNQQTQEFFGKNDRVYFRINAQGDNPTERKVKSALQQMGYEIFSYADGIAIKSGDKLGKQKFKIGKLLKDNSELLEEFRDDPLRQVQDFMLVVSRNADDIARMSTDRAWTSCMNSSRMQGVNNFHYLPKEIKHGALVAYVVRTSDPEITDPLSRIMLKVYKNKDGMVYVPGKTYGLPNQVFKDAMIDIAGQLNATMPDGAYYMADGSYEDRMGTEVTLRGGQLHMENVLKGFFYNQLEQHFQILQLAA